MPTELERQHDVVKLTQREEIPLVEDLVEGVEIGWPMARPIKGFGAQRAKTRLKTPFGVRPIGPFSPM